MARRSAGGQRLKGLSKLVPGSARTVAGRKKNAGRTCVVAKRSRSTKSPFKGASANAFYGCYSDKRAAGHVRDRINAATR